MAEELFRFARDTNGGANNFRIVDNEDGTVTYSVGGQSVQGTFSTTDIDAFLVRSGQLYDATLLASGNANDNIVDGYGTNANPLVAQSSADPTQVVLTGAGVQGTYRWDFDTAREAQNFAYFLDFFIT